MSTITLRNTKGSALTFTEGDANFTNLNADKLENLSEDTSPQLGADLDVNDFKIKSLSGKDVRIEAGNKLYLGDIQWPYTPAATIAGTVTTVDTNRNPNVLQLSNIGAIQTNNIITFTGSDVTTVGLVVGTEYKVNAIVNSNQIELVPAAGGGTISFNALSNPSAFAYSVSVPATIANSSVLTYNNGILTWAASGGGAWTSNVDASSFELQNVNLKGYREVINDLGTTDSPILNVQNGNVQKVTITNGLALISFSNQQVGQSMTLVVTGTGAATGTGSYVFAGGNKTLTTKSIISIFYDGTTYWASIATDFQA
jgi:hypothetical protein